jgi:hypothetical protein
VGDAENAGSGNNDDRFCVRSPPKFCSATQRQDVLPADTSLRSRQGDWAEQRTAPRPCASISWLKFSAGPGVNALLEPHWEDTVKIALYLIAAIALLVGLPNSIPPAYAETITLKADLKGANEVPPNASPATGKAEAKLNTETRVLTWSVTYADLTGPALGAHFHGPSEQGKNAGIVLPFKTVQSPIEGTATLTETQAADLLAGKWYANIHTQANPGGELRGQMIK